MRTVMGAVSYTHLDVYKRQVAYSSSGSRYYDFVNAENEEEFNAYIKTCTELALYDTAVTADYGDRLITLSPCCLLYTSRCV